MVVFPTGVELIFDANGLEEIHGPGVFGDAYFHLVVAGESIGVKEGIDTVAGVSTHTHNAYFFIQNPSSIGRVIMILRLFWKNFASRGQVLFHWT